MAEHTLAQLLGDIPFELLQGDPDVAVAQLSVDSRTTQPGDVFVCLPGYRTEGGETRADRHDYIGDARAHGATAIVVERAIDVPADVTVVKVENGWDAVAAMACSYYDHPSQDLTVVGVTGTSGKTSTTYFIESVLRSARMPPACFGTIEYRFGDKVVPAHQTTPEAIELQRLLRQARDSGCRAAVMEVSSHALELRRVGGIAFDVGVFTNISQDHLNFHPDMAHYLRAKARLFEQLDRESGTAVVNIDDPASEHIRAANVGALLTYAIERTAQVRATQVQATLAGTAYRASTPAGDIDVHLPHLGDYQAYNSLAALATGVALGLDLDVIRAGLESAPAIPGRFELVDCGQSFRVAVDYAHKPDALQRLLQSARSLQPKRIVTVFGCGGDRDRGKRPIMGRIAAQLSDIAIITSDNPRSEDPQGIVAEIGAGAAQVSGADVRVEVDRAAAIAMAIGLASAGDIVLIAGKGHETYQLFADRRVDFDDREHARNALRAAIS